MSNALYPDSQPSRARGTIKTLALGFLGGASAVLFLQLLTGTSTSPSFPSLDSSTLSSFLRRELLRRDAPPGPEGTFPSDIGSTLSHAYPPDTPTNDIPALFPTQVGFPGATLTGAEAFVIATAVAYPTGAGIAGLVDPGVAQGSGTGTPEWIDESGDDVVEPGTFNIFQYWGNLSPFYSVPKGAFGVQSTPEVPSGCEIKGVHILHRHGARYPDGPSTFSFRPKSYIYSALCWRLVENDGTDTGLNFHSWLCISRLTRRTIP
jgi:hypothetical protein